jgi:hypothetical protein
MLILLANDTELADKSDISLDSSKIMLAASYTTFPWTMEILSLLLYDLTDCAPLSFWEEDYYELLNAPEDESEGIPEVPLKDLLEVSFL